MMSTEDSAVVLSPEDSLTIRTLFEKYPQLWDYFKTVIEFVDSVNDQPRNYTQLQHLLDRIIRTDIKISEMDKEILQDFSRFAAAVNFAAKSVEFAREIKLKERSVSLFAIPESGVESACIQYVRSLLLNLSCYGVDFALRLSKTGVLQDLMEDLEHMQDHAAEHLEKGDVFRIIMGIFINCCRSPEGLVIIKTMNIKEKIVPFLSKVSLENKALVLTVLSATVDDQELQLLTLDKDLLQFFIGLVQGGLESEKDYCRGWLVEEVLCILSRVARNYFNKRLIVQNGGLTTLGEVLVRKSEAEQTPTMNCLAQLVLDNEAKRLMQAEASLMEALSKLSSVDSSSLRHQATDLLRKICEPGHPLRQLLFLQEQDAIDRNTQKDLHGDTPSCQQLTDLMQGCMNMLTILRIDEFGFLLCQLNLKAVSNICSHTHFSSVHLLTVLSDVIKDPTRRQQMISEGGLGTLCCFLRKGEVAEKQLVLNIILDIMSDANDRRAIMKEPGLVNLLDEVRSSEDERLSGKANLIWRTLH